MSGEAVLVVEHEEPSSEFLAQQLHGRRIRGLRGRPGRTCARARREHPDLVLLDAVLPDGYRVELIELAVL